MLSNEKGNSFPAALAKLETSAAVPAIGFVSKLLAAISFMLLLVNGIMPL